MTNTWTIESIETRRSTGDSLVTADGWSVSYTSGGGPTVYAAQFSCKRYAPGSWTVVEVDSRDGEWFPSADEAEVYALNAGRLQWYYTTDAYRSSRLAIALRGMVDRGEISSDTYCAALESLYSDRTRYAAEGVSQADAIRMLVGK